MAISMKDVLDALGQAKEWLRLKDVPERLDGLTKRVAALEAGKAAAQPDLLACPACPGVRMQVRTSAPDRVQGVFGVMRLTCICPSCGAQQERLHDPAKDPPLHG